MTEQEEIAWGNVADQDVRDNLRMYEQSQPLTDLVNRLGAEIAEHTTRPHLPWTFRIIDDPAVNAFALPGGHVFVTRGLLTHLNSPDELACVLGHEAGHIDRRHAVVEQRKAEVAQRNIAFLSAFVDPNRRHVAAVAARSKRLQLLGYEREGELEADALGVAYVGRTTYQPAAFLRVLELLQAVDVESETIPSWLTTHPEPDVRREALTASLDAAGDEAWGDEIDVEYVAMLHGVVHGPDPREGGVAGPRFHHGRVGFSVDLPDGWAIEHDTTGATALAPDNLTQMGVAPKFYTYQTSQEATDAFFISGIFRRHGTKEVDIAGTTMLLTDFSFPTRVGEWLGLVGFATIDGEVAAIMASAPATIWPQQAATIEASFDSLRRLSDAEMSALEPRRIEVAVLSKATTLAAIGEDQAELYSLDELVLLNRVGPDELLPQGRTIKLITR